MRCACCNARVHTVSQKFFFGAAFTFLGFDAFFPIMLTSERAATRAGANVPGAAKAFTHASIIARISIRTGDDMAVGEESSRKGRESAT